jgi:hypothetical protein
MALEREPRAAFRPGFFYLKNNLGPRPPPTEVEVGGKDQRRHWAPPAIKWTLAVSPWLAGRLDPRKGSRGPGATTHKMFLVVRKEILEACSHPESGLRVRACGKDGALTTGQLAGDPKQLQDQQHASHHRLNFAQGGCGLSSTEGSWKEGNAIENSGNFDSNGSRSSSAFFFETCRKNAVNGDDQKKKKEEESQRMHYMAWCNGSRLTQFNFQIHHFWSRLFNGTPTLGLPQKEMNVSIKDMYVHICIYV